MTSRSKDQVEEGMSPLSIIEPSSISHSVSKLRKGDENSTLSDANCAMPSAMKPKLSTTNRMRKCQRSPAAWIMVLTKIAVRGWALVWKMSRNSAAVA